MSCPSTLASANASRIASTSAFICASCGWVAKSGSFGSRSSGNPATPAPIWPALLSTIATRTLCVPKSTPATIGTVLRVPVDVPAKISRRRLVHRVCYSCHRARDVMLETVLADEVQQLLQAGNLHHACAVRILPSHGAGYDRLIVHLHVFEERLRQIAAVEAYGLVWIIPVVVVPIQESARRTGRECKRVHADGAAHVHLACTGKVHVAHHAHDRAWHHAEELFHRGPALDCAYRHVCFVHPAVDHETQLGHLHECFGRDAVRRDVGLDFLEFRANVRVVVREAVDASENLGQIDGLDGDPRGLEYLLAEPDRLERGRPSADCADTRMLETSYDAADAGEAAQVG